MMADYDKIMRALRNAHAAGDTEAAKRLAAMAKAAKAQAAQPATQSPQPAQASQPAERSAAMGGTFHPAPSAAIADELYNQGPIGQRFIPNAQPEAVVTAGDGSEMVFNPSTGQYTNRELMAGNIRPSAGQSFQAGAAQGFTLGTGDEIAGAIGGPFVREKARATLEASRRDHPGMTLTGEIAGAVALPSPIKGGPATLGQAVKTGAKAGAMYGGLYAAASADGGVINRLGAGAKGAIEGSIFGAAAPVAVNIGTKAFRRVFKATSQRPTLESLRTAKTVAYKAVDDAGEVFSPQDTTALRDRVAAALPDSNYVQGVDTQTDAVMKLLDGKAGQELTLGQLDKLRQNFYKRYNAAPNETGILDAIDAIDDMILSRTSTSDLVDAARLANARYKKAEVLDMAFRKAALETESTGSGGNILNKYRQAVTKILTNPKMSRWFSADEITAMEGFVRSSLAENTLRRIGKLAPGGNGLMLALNIGAVAQNPAMAGVTIAASAAKAAADGRAVRGAEALISKVGGGRVPVPQAPVSYPQGVNALAGPVGGMLPF